MTLAELIAAVYTETNRPDLVKETLQSVLEATLTVHAADDWPKSIVETLVVFDRATDYVQVLDTQSLPLYQSVAYMRKTNPQVAATQQANTLLPSSLSTPAGQLNFLTRVDIGDVMDIYNREKTDIWYQAGDQINIKSSTPLQYLSVGYYQFPNLDATGVNFKSWIARDWPYTIVYRAAGSIFAKIGDINAYSIYMKQPTPRAGMDSGGLYYQQLSTLFQQNISMG